MTSFGYTLMCEQQGPRELVRQAGLAEEGGFDFAVISDHFHPWLEVQGESPYAWSVLGAVAERTERMNLMTMVTCPIVRYHPALVAQKAATVQMLSEGRFALGLGAGENLNEHVVGMGWPPVQERHHMLAEAIEIIRELWKGGSVTLEGDYFNVHDARLYSLPPQLPPVFVAAGGSEAAALAAESGDGLIATEPLSELVQSYRRAGGRGSTWAQIAVCWAEDERRGLETAHRYFRFAVPGWKVQSELPNPVNFEAATRTVRPEDMAELMPHGPDPERYVQGINKFLDAGFENVAIVQAGPDQEGFIRFWDRELAPALKQTTRAAGG
jgi:G6PDH family F420-dependent oxidoreductase